MRIERYCPLHSWETEYAPVLSILQAHNIKHTICQFYPDQPDTILTFRVYEDHPAWPSLEPLIGDRTLCHSRYFFSPKELSSAPWLTVRSDNGTKIYTDDDAYDRTYKMIECGGKSRHRVQQAPFELRRPIKWNAGRYFYGSDGSYFTNLFTNDNGKSILNQHFSEINYVPVFKYRTSQPLPNLWQLKFLNVLPDESLVLGCGEEDISCPICGRRQYSLDNRYRLTLYSQYLRPDVDFYTTNEIFYEGFADALVVISQRAYQILCQNHLNKGLIFQPVLLR